MALRSQGKERAYEIVVGIMAVDADLRGAGVLGLAGAGIGVLGPEPAVLALLHHDDEVEAAAVEAVLDDQRADRPLIEWLTGGQRVRDDLVDVDIHAIAVRRVRSASYLVVFENSIREKFM